MIGPSAKIWFGFRPHQDYYAAARFLEGAEPEKCSVKVPLGGPDGKPTFIAGPYDNVNRIMNQLRRKVGDGNFHYLIPVAAPELMLDDDEYDEDEEVLTCRKVLSQSPSA